MYSTPPEWSCETLKGTKMQRRRCFSTPTASRPLATSSKQFDEVMMILIRKGTIIMIRGHPCQITEIGTTPANSLGHIQIIMGGFDIFTGEKFEEVDDPSSVRQSPVQDMSKIRLMKLSQNGMCILSNDNGITFKTVPLPPESGLNATLKQLLEQGRQPIVTILACLDQQCIINIHRI